MRKSCFLLLLACLTQVCSAQVIEVTGTTGPNAGITMSYPALTSPGGAFLAINAGVHTGAITVSVVSDNTAETGAASLNASGSGSSFYTSITITPSGARTLGTSTGTTLITFNGADNVTINGINAGGNSLTLSNSGGSTSTVTFVDGAQNNTISNCTLLGIESNATSGLIWFAGSSVAAGGNSNNTVSNCNIGGITSGNGPRTAIYSSGQSAARLNANNIIRDNFIYDYFKSAGSSAGINLAANNADWTIEGNRLYQTANRVFTSGGPHYGIGLFDGNGYTVKENVIGYANGSGTGTMAMAGNSAALSGFPSSYSVSGTANALTVFPIYCELDAGGTATTISGNEIGGIAVYTSANYSGATAVPTFAGIYLQSGDAVIGGATVADGNMIGAASGSGSVYVATTANNGTVSGIHSISTGTVTISNNRVGSIDAVGTTSAVGAELHLIHAGRTGAYTITDNTLGNATPNNVRTAYTLSGGMLSNAGTIQSSTATTALIFGVWHDNASTAALTITGNTMQGWESGATNNGGSIGISVYQATSGNVVITGNSIGTAAAGWMHNAFANAYGAYNIRVNTSNSLSHIISNNILRPATSSVAGSGSHIGINTFSNTTTGNATQISNNEFVDYLVNVSSGFTYLMYVEGNRAAGTSLMINGNFTTGGYGKSAGGAGAYGGYLQFNSAQTAAITISNNNFTNCSAPAGTQIYGWSVSVGTTSAANVNFTNNIISNLSGGSVIYGLSLLGGGSNGGNGNLVSGNTISGLNTAGTAIYGVSVGGQPPLLTMSRNKLYDFTCTSATSGVTVHGLLPGNALSSFIDNNYIGNFTAASATGTSSETIAGIAVYSSATPATFELTHNTVYFSGTNTTGINTCAILHSANATSNLGQLVSRNNIFVNNISHSAGSGSTAAFRRTGTALANYAATSDYNFYYAGVPGARNLIYSDGTNSLQTIARFRNLVQSRDHKSVSDIPVFLSVAGANANYLHVDPAVASRLESGGTYVAAVPQDYDLQARNTTAPDIGADEFSGIMKDSSAPVITVTVDEQLCDRSHHFRIRVQDVTGIPTSGSYVPQLYVNAPTAPSLRVAGTFVSGTATDSYWDFNLTPTGPSLGTGAAAGDVVRYIFVAQDNILTVPNIGSYPRYGYWDDVLTPVSSVNPMPNSYTIGAYPAGTWLGYNTNWFDAMNWCGGVPVSTTDVTIPAGASFYPMIGSGVAIARNISIASGVTFTCNGTGRLRMHGNLTGAGFFDVSTGELELAGTSAPVLKGARLASHSVSTLIISGNSSIDAAATEYVLLNTKLKFESASRTFQTNDNLTVQSSATKTAVIADMTNNGGFSGNQIFGTATVERFISAGRKWRFIANNTAGSQSVNASWMEGNAPSGNTGAPGYGTWITDPAGTSANFDAASVSASMKYWYGDHYEPIIDPNIFPIHAQPAYMIYVRGNRSIPNTGSTTSTTTLRTKGLLNQGTQPAVDILAFNELTVVGNPYASGVNLSKLNWSSILSQTIHVLVWDPLLAGSYGVGGFQTLTRVLGQPDFRISPGGGSYTGVNSGDVMNIIESGQAFFVESGVTDNSVQFIEAAKDDGAHEVFFTAGQPQNIFGRLFIRDNVNNPTLADGFAVLTNANYATGADREDARKFSNTNENVSVKQGSVLHATDLRATVQDTDTIFLNIANMRALNYRWEIDMRNMDAPGRTGFLIDKFKNTSLQLNLAGTTPLDFTVSAASGSYAPDRFMIVFSKATEPVSVPVQTVMAVPAITIAPNPVENKTVNIRFAKQTQGLHSVLITDDIGRTVFTGGILVQSELHTERIELKNVSAGSYFISISDSKGNIHRQKIVVL